MNCAEFETLLTDYIDGTLPTRERDAMDLHTAQCVSCREFVAEVRSGLSLLESAPEIEPPQELITRIAYLAPQGRVRDPFEQQSALGRLISRWLMPVLQPRLAMGMAMTILSFAMLKRCTGVEVHQLQPADLNPVRIWGGVEDKALRAKDQAVKYYENLRIVYEFETHMKDIEAAQNTPANRSAAQAKSGNQKSNGASQSSKGNKP
jgi:anti-sigma factor RsiW